ncbi:MAG: GNAT family N-acetyltransferase [Dehalococcoidia bacterium]|nr:GNAT family N-acetyltransferase [Dehalococcoidia bacterium]
MQHDFEACDLTPSAAHLDEIDELRASIDWGPGSWTIGPMLRTGGRVLALRDETGRLAAMGGAAVMAPGGFICNMVVRPEHKRRGMGRRIFNELIAWLQQNGHASIQLEATDEGRPLYEQAGFRVRWHSIGSTLSAPPERGDETGLEVLQTGDWPGIAALDRQATGAERTALFRQLTAWEGFREGLVLREGGSIAGYGLRFANRIGPVVAASPGAAERLARALAARSERGTIATIGHPQHATLWQGLGFDVTPFDARMALGPDLPGDPSMVYCMLNGGLG